MVPLFPYLNSEPAQKTKNLGKKDIFLKLWNQKMPHHRLDSPRADTETEFEFKI